MLHEFRSVILFLTVIGLCGSQWTVGFRNYEFGKVFHWLYSDNPYPHDWPCILISMDGSLFFEEQAIIQAESKLEDGVVRAGYCNYTHPANLTIQMPISYYENESDSLGKAASLHLYFKFCLAEDLVEMEEEWATVSPTPGLWIGYFALANMSISLADTQLYLTSFPDEENHPLVVNHRYLLVASMGGAFFCPIEFKPIVFSSVDRNLTATLHLRQITMQTYIDQWIPGPEISFNQSMDGK
ncbi:hypothetical protein Ciccas_008429 [Cichlidogyrus casuarinus]|uniref:Uncharacterized protein n=1 Tax=Cichlidogyrus casuarinus TaxID=1844966 RepID=A0ABD2Q1G4_9PLAT